MLGAKVLLSYDLFLGESLLIRSDLKPLVFTGALWRLDKFEHQVYMEGYGGRFIASLLEPHVLRYQTKVQTRRDATIHDIASYIRITYTRVDKFANIE